MNEAALEMFGLTEIGSDIEKLGHLYLDPEGMENFKHGLAAMAEGDTEYTGERPYKSPDGGIRYLQTSWKVIPGHEATLGRVLTANTDITQRKHLENRLRIGEQYLTAAEEVINLGTWEWDIGAEVFYGSEEARRHFGFPSSAESVHMSELTAIVHPEDLRRVQAEMAEAVASDLPWVIQARICPPGGSTKHIYVKGQTYRNSRQEPVRAFGISFDMSENKRIEDLHRILGEKQKLAQSIAQMSTSEWMLKTGEIRWSEETYRLLGLDPDKTELTQGIYNSLIHPDDKEMVEDTYRRLTEGDHRFAVDYRIVRPDGSVRWIHARAVLLYDSGGNPDRVISSGIDITERIERETALRESQAKYKALYENAVVAMFRTSIADSRGLAVNDTGAALFGYASKEDFLANFRALDHYVDPNDRNRLLAEIRAKDRVEDFLIEFKRKDGSRFWAKFNARIYPEDGYLEGALIDVTAQVQAENALKSSDDQFRSLFENSPIPLFELDCSPLTVLFEELRASGITGFRRYFRSRPLEAESAGRLVRVKDVNRAAVAAFKADSHQQLRENFSRLGGRQFQSGWVAIVTAFAEGKQSYSKDIRLHTLKRNIRDFAMKWSVPNDSRNRLDIVYLSVTDITNRKRLERALKRSESELGRKADKLEETNTAMDVLLKKRLSDKKELEESMLYNIRELVAPYLAKLRRTELDATQELYLGIIERNLGSITSPFLRGISLSNMRFTRAELQVVNCIQQGMSTKQMAEHFDLSPRTVESYRDHIRDKLGIKKKKMNLRTYLMSKG